MHYILWIWYIYIHVVHGALFAAAMATSSWPLHQGGAKFWSDTFITCSTNAEYHGTSQNAWFLPPPWAKLVDTSAHGQLCWHCVPSTEINWTETPNTTVQCSHCYPDVFLHIEPCHDAEKEVERWSAKCGFIAFVTLYCFESALPIYVFVFKPMPFVFIDRSQSLRESK